MNLPTDNTSELCHCGEHDNAGEKNIPMHHSSGGGGGAELLVVGGSVDLSVCQRVDKSGLSTVSR